MPIASRRLQHNFSKTAREYDARAQFQHHETRRVLDAALMVFPQSARIVDIGCGTGYFAAAAADKRPEWNIVGLDIAQGMCDVAVQRCTVIRGDAAHLPLAEGSVDAVVSSLCYQWVEHGHAAFNELARILRPGGRAIVATLGESSLRELRTAANEAGLPLGLLPMRSFASSEAMVTEARLEITLAECRVITEHYANVSALLESMRGIGAGNNFSTLGRGLVSPRRWAAMLKSYDACRVSQGIPATWEHHFFILRKPV